MPLLQVRDCPDKLYLELKNRAAHEHRSVAQQTVVALENYLGLADSAETRRARRSRALANLQSHPLPGDLDPVAIVREDRDLR